MIALTPLQIFEKFVPKSAARYCAKLYEHFGFEFKIKRGRQTKMGDFRFDPRDKKHTITVNNDLNPYAFLITYLHEVAHLVTFKAHGNKVLPHGKEWKLNFRKVVQPVLKDEIFPPPLLHVFNTYLKDPKASSCSDPRLYSLLKNFDFPNGKISLSKIQIGEDFIFNGKHFKKLQIRRTRSICMEIHSARKYLISEVAEVEKVT